MLGQGQSVAFKVKPRSATLFAHYVHRLLLDLLQVVSRWRFKRSSVYLREDDFLELDE